MRERVNAMCWPPSPLAMLTLEFIQDFLCASRSKANVGALPDPLLSRARRLHGSHADSSWRWWPAACTWPPGISNTMRLPPRVTEVALAFATVDSGHRRSGGAIAWGVWWAWDARLTSMLMCWLIYAGYLMLRRAIEEPTQRARLSAVVSILRLRRCVLRLEIDRVVPHATSRPGAEHPRRRRHGAGHGSPHLLELAGAAVLLGGAGHGPHAPGRILARDRLPAPSGAFILNHSY